MRRGGNSKQNHRVLEEARRMEAITTKTEKVLRSAFNKLVKQGPKHRDNIIPCYPLLKEAAESEFTEDNKPTLDAFLKECFEESFRL